MPYRTKKNSKLFSDSLKGFLNVDVLRLICIKSSQATRQSFEFMPVFSNFN